MLIFLFFFALWLLFNGRITWDVVLFGLVLCALVTAFAVKVCGWSPAKSRQLAGLTGPLLGYAFCLLAAIVKANLATLRAILSFRGSPVHPQIFRFDSRLQRNSLQTLLANSITLTPGTYTLRIEGSTLTVHALNAGFARGTPDDGLLRRLAEMERRLDGDAERGTP